MKALLSFLSVLLGVALAIPAARPYAHTILSILGGVAAIGTALAILPGRVGDFFAALGHDAEGMRDAIESPRPAKVVVAPEVKS